MISILLKNPLFKGTTPEELTNNFEGINYHIKNFKKGDILAFQGDPWKPEKNMSIRQLHEFR